MLTVANRLDSVGFSNVRKIYEKATTLSASGKKVYNLILGEPDFPTPKIVSDKGIEAILNEETHYTSNYGVPELRTAIAEKLTKVNHIPATSDEVLLTIGATEAISIIMMGILNPGDEVIIPSPTWGYYESCPKLAGATPVEVPLVYDKGAFSLRAEDIEKAITERTRMLVINSPGNPTGMIIDKETLLAISEIAIKHDLIVVSDEIYEKIIYDNQLHCSIASLPGMKERTITVNGFSKAYAMTGWRIGYLHAPSNLLNGLVRVHQYNVTCLPSFTQKAALTALQEAEPDVVKMREEFNRRRDLIVDILSKSENIEIEKPEGAFYLFINISHTGKTSNEIALELLEKTGVALAPGNAFGNFGEGYVRLSFAASVDILQEAGEKIVNYLNNINKKESVH
ncbi:pyridoxal phosphate-dependent aminotransferase [Niallia sp. 01092]|uniref:pyridoxal phosphate-dependent aminotransferase n=1 Tax=unclassified Niallia TaxID=2837522 RepID=UPI003FD63782